MCPFLVTTMEKQSSPLVVFHADPFLVSKPKTAHQIPLAHQAMTHIYECPVRTAPSSVQMNSGTNVHFNQTTIELLRPSKSPLYSTILSNIHGLRDSNPKPSSLYIQQLLYHTNYQRRLFTTALCTHRAHPRLNPRSNLWLQTLKKRFL